MRPTRLAVFAAAVLFSVSASAFAGDYIQKKDGSFSPPFKGTRPEAAADFDASDWQVLDANAAEILYTIPVGGKAQTQRMPAADVMDIVLEPKDLTNPWKDAANALQAGEWASAAAKFRAIGDAKTIHPVARQKALLNAARATSGPGDSKSILAADAAYEYLLGAFPASFYTRSVWKDRWIMFIDANNPVKAKEAIDQLLKLPGVTDSDKLEARFASTTINLRAAVAAKDKSVIQKSLDEYKAVSAETTGKPALASISAQARIGMGNCMLELGNAGEAKGIFADISDRPGENAVLAAAFNGLGECWFRENNAKGNAEALRCFLRTQLRYADGASPDSVAKAIYFTGECFYRLSDPRARQELQSCIARFPSSPWADKARKLKDNLSK